jgi:2-oxo-4-hydroxy-4-carboxy-5-ureidoimidazoline decarboxylase
MHTGVEWLNALPEQDAERELHTCCASAAWARKVTAARPFADAETLTRAADEAFAPLGWADIEEALRAHPRVGDRLCFPDQPTPPTSSGGLDRESSWSRTEQAGVIDADKDVTEALHEENGAYERKFGHVFLICATGLSAEQMLAALRERLGNDEAAEREVVRAELLKITHLRLTKLLERP